MSPRILVHRPLFRSALMLAAVLALPEHAPAQARDAAARIAASPLPPAVRAARLERPITVTDPATLGRLDTALAGATGPQRVIVRLTGGSLAESAPDGAPALAARRAEIEVRQLEFIDRARSLAPGAQVLARTRLVLNAVFLEADASHLAALARDPGVLHVHRVRDYELDLAETVPHVGAAAAQAQGIDGTGVRVAVLDSGIDYLHANLGGSGNPLDFSANDPTVIEPGSFPTAKVVGGYDFVGSAWFGGSGSPAEAPDPDPLDAGSGGGHGTHVADIIGGISLNPGVAPGVSLLAVKVCSSISTACSGVALIQGMEYAVDPDGDGDPADHVDVVNMSLGSPYGQPFDDDLSQAVDNATALGVLSVASAGNSADKPFVVGSPSAARTALSVAETQVPSAYLQMIDADGTGYPGVFQPWSVPPAGVISGPLQYGDGAVGNLNGCAAFAAGSLAGKIVLVDRGVCAFSEKIGNISGGGGAAGIIGLVAPGAPFGGGYGGGPAIAIPGYMISQADADAIKAAIADGGAAGVIDPDDRLPLVGQMVGSSSRGPQFESCVIKPEIGAPGASVSAIAGSGTGTEPFGGTSGAAPMVSGAAALLLQAWPGHSPRALKARLMNSAETDIDVDPFLGAAEISRVGAGELRVDRALAAPAVAWDRKFPAGSLGFGFADVADRTRSFTKRVRVRNYSPRAITYAISRSFRYAEDAASGAVTLSAPRSLRVPAGETGSFEVLLTVKGRRLAGNWLNSGSGGADGGLLRLNEFDGFLTLDGGSHTLRLPWHVLPRKAARVAGDPSFLAFAGRTQVDIELRNSGVGTAQVDAYSLLGVSPNLPAGRRGEQSPRPDLRAAGVSTLPTDAGFCGPAASFVWAFAVNVWEPEAHAVAPASFRWDLDTDRDGVRDYAVFNADLSGGISDGRNVTWAAAYDVSGTNLGPATAEFYTEHSTVTGNTVLYVCGEQVGLGGADIQTTRVDVTGVYADDTYFEGPGDAMGPFTITPLGERFLPFPVDVPGEARARMTVTDLGLLPGNTPELGVMLFTNGDRGTGARGGATLKTETLFLPTRASQEYVTRTVRRR